MGVSDLFENLFGKVEAGAGAAAAAAAPAAGVVCGCVGAPLASAGGMTALLLGADSFQ